MRSLSLALTAVVALSASASAELVSVTQNAGTSNVGGAAGIIGAPAKAENSELFNTAMQGFDEAQGVVVGPAVGIDGGGMIAAGTHVDSHMIFLNKEDGVAGLLSHGNVTWEFDGWIIGVMSDSGGTLEAASTGQLGAPGTSYDAPFGARGLEGVPGDGMSASDGYTVHGKSITVGMAVTQPGDWIRVVTVVPEPTSMALFAFGAAGFGFVASRRRKQTA